MANTTNFNWETPDDTDLVKDGAAAIRTLGSAIDTSLVDLKGGTTGQVLAKNSNTDMDFIWASDATGIPATIFDAKGDIIAATAADTAARLAVGTNGHVLTADSSTATGLKWAAAAGGGKVLQVVAATTTTTVTSTTTTYIDTGLTATITPSSSNSKVMILGSVNGVFKVTNNSGVGIKWFRGATELAKVSQYAGYTGTSTANQVGSVGFCYLDTPATTSATTYKAQFNSSNGAADCEVQGNDSMSTLLLLEIGA